jgi:hypothetical protein
MRGRVSASTLLLSCLLGGNTALADNATPLTPEQIFAATFAKLHSYPVAPYVIYGTFWNISQTYTAGGTRQTVSYTAQHRYAVRSSDGVDNIMLKRSGKELPTAAMAHEFVGPFGWSLRGPAHARTSSGMSPDVESGLKVIATVAAVARPPYTISLAGLEAVDGHATYHLKLTPDDEPDKHNLRDLWVDRTTFDLRKAHFVGTYSPDGVEPASPSDVTVLFGPIGEYWIAMRDIWTFRQFDNGIYFLFDAQITSIAFAKSLPDWIFDASGYEKHRAAKEPDCLQTILDTGSGVCDDATETRE